MLDAAVRIFAEKGYHGASMADIAEDVGVTKPMVYAYFGSKEELYLACIERAAARLRQALEEAGAGEDDPERLLWRRLLAFFEFVGEHGGEWRVLGREAKSAGGPVGERLEQARGEISAQVTRQLVEVDAAGTEKRELEVFAHALVGAGEAIGDWWVDHPEEPAEAMALRLMNLVWIGFEGLARGRRWVPAP